MKMKIRSYIILFILCASASVAGAQEMKKWRTHFAYNNISVIEDADDKAYCLSEGALLSVDKETEELRSLSKLTGMSGSDAQLIAYNRETRKTLVVYKNGQTDIIYPNGDVEGMLDLFLTIETHPCDFYSAFSYKDRVYICTSIGILNINMRRNEVAETYVLLDGDTELQTHAVSVLNDSIFAVADDAIYAASLQSNLIDYASWQPISEPFDSTIVALGSKEGAMYALAQRELYRYRDGAWKRLMPDKEWANIYLHTASVIARTSEGALYEFNGEEGAQLPFVYEIGDIVRSGQALWFSVPEEGLRRWTAAEGTQYFAVNSPGTNFSYRLRATSDKLIMLPGGYFAANFYRTGQVMSYENGFWRNYNQAYLTSRSGAWRFNDLCDAAIDPTNPSHFFVASFGFGLMEFYDNEYHHLYLPSNTENGLEQMLDPELGYTWVDGLTLDADGNLWMLNNSYNGVKVLMKNGKWVRFGNEATQKKSRTQDLIIWNQDTRIKALTCARVTPGIGVFSDNGTISYTGDDKSVFFSSFIDQNGKTVAPQYVYCMCQMANGEVWLGTENGVIIIPDLRKTLAGSNACRRVIIPRNDGTGLGDYLLGDERINAIAEDAAGRKWIGTETSGLYLISEDGLDTYEHFTKYNSPLVSDGIYALAIMPRTGEVFVGTSVGLLSYQSDANDAQEDMSNIYAYPNPVRESYQGYISITGLMDNTVVNIVDAGGNVVCKTRSNGGIAVWDGKDAYGRRATPGVYTAICNAEGGHNVCKILVMHETR